MSAKEVLSATWQILKDWGGVLIAQSDTASGKYLDYKLEEGKVESAKVFMTERAKSLAEAEAKLLDKFLDATPEERIRIQQDLEFVQGETQQVIVSRKSVEYVPEFAAKIVDERESPEEEAGETTSHWIDEFTQLSRKRLEPWRQDLLARARALEALIPGEVTLRTLWAIGVLEEEQFQAFSTLLDLSSNVNGSYIVPTANEQRVIPKCELGEDLTVGNLTFILNDTEILGYRRAHKHYKEGQPVYASYRSQSYRITSTTKWSLHGVCASRTGTKISYFYDERATDLGQKIFDEWIQGLEATEQFTVEPITKDEALKGLLGKAEE